ncbi:MAG: 23S rRNA (guanosine(2251)-2'-O)-methyltransferase RlmB [Nitrospiraceae bacterium]|nr:23S rRNA (guanosine(2251)-2'-O)-methyltransferase RlmB [Nitrospiraceae bacterium]
MLIYGLNPVVEALKAGTNVQEIYISSGRKDKNFFIEEKAKNKGIAVKIVSPKFFDSFPKGNQGIAAKTIQKDYVSIEELFQIPSKKNQIPFFLILDGIEDPGNLGAILRSADAAGVHGVIIQEHRSAGLSPAVAKTSAGASEHVPVAKINNIKHAMSEMKDNGITVIGAEAGSEVALWDADLNIPLAVVVGSEGKGLRKTVTEQCDFIVSLPMKGTLNSLNASVTAGIIFFEILRQRLSKK